MLFLSALDVLLFGRAAWLMNKHLLPANNRIRSFCLIFPNMVNSKGLIYVRLNAINSCFLRLFELVLNARSDHPNQLERPSRLSQIVQVRLLHGVGKNRTKEGKSSAMEKAKTEGRICTKVPRLEHVEQQG